MVKVIGYGKSASQKHCVFLPQKLNTVSIFLRFFTVFYGFLRFFTVFLLVFYLKIINILNRNLIENRKKMDMVKLKILPKNPH